MAGKGRGGDGLTYLGVRNGKKWWRARLEWIDPLTGKKRNSKQEFAADSKILAGREREQRIEQKKGARTARTDRKRFGEGLDEYLTTVTVYSTQRSWGYFGRRLKAQFGDWWLDMVNERHLQDYLDAVELSASSVASLRAILRKVFEYAMRKHWVTTNPARHLSPRAAAKARADLDELADPPKRSLTLEEAALFLANVKEHEPLERYLIIVTQMVLGCRFAEVSALTWKDVDLESGVITLRRGQVLGRKGLTKGKYARIAALDLELRRDLKQHRERMAEYLWPGWDELVFPRPVSGNQRQSNFVSRDTTYAAIKRTFKRLGWPNLPVGTHVARHTMHNVAQEHASALLLRKVVGHKTEKMSLTYTATDAAKVIELGQRVGSSLKSGIKSVKESVNGPSGRESSD